jgi:putative transposase
VDAPCELLPVTGHANGIDMGLKALLTSSAGISVANPRWFRKMERRLIWHQQHVARCNKGSRRRRKALTLLAKCSQSVRRKRLDFHHKAAVKLVRANGIICHEQLQVRDMAQHRHLAKSIGDAGWSQFLTVKAACAGREIMYDPSSIYDARL